MQRSQVKTSGEQQTELSIEKALEFAGDNSEYQKKRLLFIAMIVLSLAVLTCKMAFAGTAVSLLFLAGSGLGQLLAPAYLSLDFTALALILLSALAALTFPFSPLLTQLALVLIGFFGRGFFACGLLYLDEIGGERFKAWSLIVVFAVWGVASLLAALQGLVGLPSWFWYYGLVFVPLMVCCRWLLAFWKPSPSRLCRLRMFKEAKQVLNEMAHQNNRPPLVYGLQGEHAREQGFGNEQAGYYELLHEPCLQQVTLPLGVLWVFREYTYYGSLLLLPELSSQYAKNFILVSISETVAVLLSYPIRLKIRRVNTLFSLALMVCLAAALSSFTTLPPECSAPGERCSAKYLYRVSIMVIRFAIALAGNVLIGYTAEVYPANLKHTAYAFCLGVSSLGSVVLPWVGAAMVGWGWSGFIGIAVVSLVALYFVPKLPQTHGRTNNDVFVDWEKRAPLIPLESWKRIAF